jgi:hypothetical protein
MARSQLEDELLHLERIIAHLRADSALGPAYWRGRIARLDQDISPTPGEARRIRRLLNTFDAIGPDADLARNRA